MDAQRFLAEFGYIAGAPGGIQRLRQLILQLAVTGKLVEQIASEEPANIWLETIRERKHQLQTVKLIPKQTQFLPVEKGEYPFALPHGWIFVRLGEITSKIGSGSTPRGGREVYVKEGVPFLRSQNIWNDGLRLDDVAHISLTEHERMSSTTVHKNDILLNITGASLGRCSLVSSEFSEANVSQHVSIIRPTNPDVRFYLHIAILSPYIQTMIWERQVGMAREGLSKKVLEQFEIPLPPLAEQKRIVAKVDELMALCDKLEAQQQKLHKLHTLSRNSVLQAISSASSKEEFHTAWLRFQHSSPLLLREESDVQHLRDVVFHLGVTGMLSSPDSQPKNLSELFIERTTSYSLDAEELARTGVRVPALSEIRIDDTITVPINWRVMTLESACTFIIDCPHSTPKFSSSNFYCIDTTCIEPRKILWQKARTVSEDSYKERISRLRPKVGDLLFSREGTIGTAVMINDDVNLCLGQRMMLFRFAPFVLPEYAEIFLLSGYFKQQYEKFIKGTAAKHLNIGDIRQLTIVFPSIEVQRKIIDVVNKLGAYCDSLNIQLSSKAQIAQKLSEAVITTITGIGIEEEKTLKTPKTELISKLRLANNPDIKEQAPLAAILARHQSEMSAGDLWQRYGGEIDAFYAQLKQEVGKGWIAEPAIAEMRETEAG